MARRTWTFALGAVALVAAVQGLDTFAKGHMLLVNRSPSLPNWAYFIEKGASPRRGEVAFFVAPRNELVLSHFGASPVPFGKLVYGLPGDLVEHRGGRVLIRSAQGTQSQVQTLDVGALKPRTSKGEPLIAGPTGRIPPDCYYMGSPHRDGFDSRYAAIGFVCRRQLVGVARKVIL